MHTSPLAAAAGSLAVHFRPPSLSLQFSTPFPSVSGMELQSGSPLTSQSLPGAPRRSPPRRCPDGGGEDRISALPDDMLLQVLLRLRCARAAAFTSSLSRRWRGLWRHLCELSFREIALDALDAALQQVACPALSRLEVHIPERHMIMDPARVSALLHAAAQLAPADLVIDVWGHCEDGDIPIEIPSFERATSIELRLVNLNLTLPAESIEFPVLERLVMDECQFESMNMVELVSRCPHLRVLQLWCCRSLDTVKIHSSTIEVLALDIRGWLSNLDIVAPVLKKLTLIACAGRDFSMLFSAPMVGHLTWSCSFHHRNVGIGDTWCVRWLDIRTRESAYVLLLDIQFQVPAVFSSLLEDLLPDTTFSQQIAPLPEISVLEIYLGSYGHVFGTMMLNLLGTCTTILRLKMVMRNSEYSQVCPLDCLCDESPNWRSQSIPLMSLEEVEIDGFEGTVHEVDFLKLLFRCATQMKIIIVRLSRRLFPSHRGYKEMHSIFKANPRVKFYVYRSSGLF